MPFCQECTNATYCTKCQVGYLLNSTSTCIKITCAVAYYNICLNSTACYACDYLSNYAVNNLMTCSLCDSSLNQFINQTSPLK